MKSQYGDRETLGTQLLKTYEEHMKSSPIEAGELAHEGGKSYMKMLIETVEDHRNIRGIYYIQVIPKKELYAGNRAIYFRFFARRSEPLMEDDMDVWYVNNKTCELRLEWSLPHWSEFDIFLRNPDEHDKNLIKWILKYKKMQER